MEESNKGFTVIDRRLTDNGAGASSEESSPSGQDRPSEEPPLLPEPTFSTFILSLATSVLVQLGELPDPISNQKEMNLPLARQTISLIEILEQKTKGNLAEEEARLLESMLYDLRMQYLCAAKLPGCER
jgi:hypothetical protein